MTLACMDCLWWEENRTEGGFSRGDCRRHSPVSFQGGPEFAHCIDTVWPETKESDFCGDFDRVEKPEDDEENTCKD